MKAFYHGTKTALNVGDTLVARSARPKRQAMRTGASLTAREQVEKLFERYRAAGKPSRLKSFFLAETPRDVERLGASSAEHVYRVAPVGGVKSLHRGDFEWLWQAGSIQMGLDRGLNVSVASGLVTYLPWDLDEKARVALEKLVKKLVLSYWRGKRSNTFRGWEFLAPKIRVLEKIQ